MTNSNANTDSQPIDFEQLKYHYFNLLVIGIAYSHNTIETQHFILTM